MDLTRREILPIGFKYTKFSIVWSAGLLIVKSFGCTSGNFMDEAGTAMVLFFFLMLVEYSP
jgi:hypothetical protein